MADAEVPEQLISIEKMADVSEKLERIDTSVANMRTSLGLTEANTIEEVATNIDKLKENNAKFKEVNYNIGAAKLITEIKDILVTSAVTNFDSFFSSLTGLIKISFDKNSDFSNVTNMISMFSLCGALTDISGLKTSNVTNMIAMFKNCTSLVNVPEMDTSNVTSMSSMFQDCRKIKTIPNFDTNKVTSIAYMFRDCDNLTAIPALDCSSVTDITMIVFDCYRLENIGGFINLGKNYDTTKSAGYAQYSLYLNNTSSTAITHDSLMNVINNLYDIATKGCNPQKLVLGSTLLAKLTSEEIAIATNKGWTVS